MPRRWRQACMDLVVLEDDGQRKLMVRADFGSLDREAERR